MTYPRHEIILIYCFNSGENWTPISSVLDTYMILMVCTDMVKLSFHLYLQKQTLVGTPTHHSENTRGYIIICVASWNDKTTYISHVVFRSLLEGAGQVCMRPPCCLTQAGRACHPHTCHIDFNDILGFLSSGHPALFYPMPNRRPIYKKREIFWIWRKKKKNSINFHFPFIWWVFLNEIEIIN